MGITFFLFSLPVQTALCFQHLYLILHSTVSVMVGAGRKQAAMYLLIGHGWSIHTTKTAAPNPIPVGQYHVTKQASKQ
jgi:hypothetical protein